MYVQCLHGMETVENARVIWKVWSELETEHVATVFHIVETVEGVYRCMCHYVIGSLCRHSASLCHGYEYGNRVNTFFA